MYNTPKHFKILLSGLIGVLILFVGCKDGKRYHNDLEETSSRFAPKSVQSILTYQQAQNDLFADPETSPLPDRYRKDFVSLDFFAPDTNFIVEARLERIPEALPFLMPTTTGESSEEIRYGILHFELLGKSHQLEVYRSTELMGQQGYEDYLFLPFLDATNGNETYTGGRYLDLRIPKGDSLQIDFNKAYNPYCAYNKKYSCPIVPVVNTLNLPVKAGVKAFVKG